MWNAWVLVLVLPVQARIVAEAANGPVTPPAEEIMERNGIVLLPDLLLNAVRPRPGS